MELNEIKIGLRVEVKKLGDTKGMMIKRRHLYVRKVGVKGAVIGYVPGHGEMYGGLNTMMVIPELTSSMNLKRSET